MFSPSFGYPRVAASDVFSTTWLPMWKHPTGNILGDSFSIINLKRRHPQIYCPSSDDNFSLRFGSELYLFPCFVFVAVFLRCVCFSLCDWCLCAGGLLVWYCVCFLCVVLYREAFYPRYDKCHSPGTDTFPRYIKYLSPGTSYKRENYPTRRIHFRRQMDYQGSPRNFGTSWEIYLCLAFPHFEP